LIEQILRRDPPGIYGRMDFTSRDRYRHSIEELAEPTGEAQVRVALRAIESARQAAEQRGLESIAAHVGHHLIARGRRELEIDVAYYPAFKQRVRRALFTHVTLFTDCPDAGAERLPGEEEVLDAAVADIKALNARYAPGAEDRFYLFHRARRWNGSEGVWMGWGRKRGKIEEFNRLLRGAAD